MERSHTEHRAESQFETTTLTQKNVICQLKKKEEAVDPIIFEIMMIN